MGCRGARACKGPASVEDVDGRLVVSLEDWQVPSGFLGTTRASGHGARSDQKLAESTQLRLALLKGTEFPEISCFLADWMWTESVAEVCHLSENVRPRRRVWKCGPICTDVFSIPTKPERNTYYNFQSIDYCFTNDIYSWLNLYAFMLWKRDSKIQVVTFRCNDFHPTDVFESFPNPYLWPYLDTALTHQDVGSHHIKRSWTILSGFGDNRRRSWVDSAYFWSDRALCPEARVAPKGCTILM